MIGVTYYTNDSYKAHADELLESAARVGVRVVARKLAPTTTWSAALRYKPDLILEALDEFKGEDVLYLDADVRFVRPPKLLLLAGDFDVAWNWYRPKLPLGCALFFRNNAKARLLASTWKLMFELYPDVRLDEVLLSYAYREVKGRVGLLSLPPAYGWMQGMRRRFPGAEPVLFHLGVGAGSDKPDVLRDRELLEG